MKGPLSLLRKGSAFRRVWTSPPVPTERYDFRPCLCVFVARFDRRIFYYSSKTDSSIHLLMARPRHCLSATHGWPSLNNSQCSSAVYTHSVYWVARQEASRQRGAGKERGGIEGGRDGGNKGEGGSDDVRQRGSGSGGREGRLREG